MSSRSILLVAYFYPPCTDTGAQRPAAMVKWLRRLGHRVTVLTTSAYGTEAPGAELADATHRSADLQLLRARLAGEQRIGAMYDSDTYSGRPHPLSRVVVPEPLLAAWGPFALARAHRLARRERFDAVITTSPPETVHAIGRALRRRHGIPWVADIRDAWNFEPLRPPFPTRLQRRIDLALERRWLGSADVVAGVSEPAIADFENRLEIAATALITNGWDPEGEPAEIDRAPGDHPSSPSQVTGLLDPERVSLVYTGRFGSYGRDPAGLLDGLARLAAADPSAAAKLELVVAGPLTEAERPLFDRDVAPARIVLAGSLPRAQALGLQRSADALLLLALPTRSQLLNFKLFEYLAAGPPILALAAGTDAGRVATESGGEAVRADDPEAIAVALGKVARGELIAPDASARETYIYPGPAERMAAAVELAITRARG